MSTDDSLVITCPLCGGGCLHHGVVHVFTRLVEDKPDSFHTIHDPFGVTYPAIAEGENPSPRRNGLYIEMSCETCSDTPRMKLAIFQHKGVRYF